MDVAERYMQLFEEVHLEIQEFLKMSSLEENIPRLERMDIARGLGILFEILGHNEACTRGSLVFHIIYNVPHFSLFQILS